MGRPVADQPCPALSVATSQALAATAAEGEQRRTLEALRDSIAEAMASASPSEIAPLSKQLRDTLSALEAVKVPEVPSRADEVAAARAARLAGADVPPRSARKVVGGRRSGGTGGKRGTADGRGAAKRPSRSAGRAK